jgi:hypothetical protein
METPPNMLPPEGHSSAESLFARELAVSDILLNILSRLTVYQSLPESNSLLHAVRDDVAMVDACCLFLPSAGSTSSVTTIEVLASASFGTGSPDSPDSKSKRLLNMSAEPTRDRLFAKALQREAARVTSAIARDLTQIDPVGDFLSVSDFFYFTNALMTPSSEIKVTHTTTVAAWLDLKRNACVSSAYGEWRDFCEKSVLVKRAFLNISQGIRPNQVVTGSTMNMSSSNLASEEGTKVPKSGGCTLVAVTELLDRPWQTNLPLTVSTEKGISCIFAYTSLQQLIAHAAMNCSDPLLEPFFNAPIQFPELQMNPHNPERLISEFALVGDAIKVLCGSPFAIITSEIDKKFKGLVLPDDLFELIGSRMDAPTAEKLTDLPIQQLLSQTEDVESIIIHERDFPIHLSLLLQRLLLARSGFLVVLSSQEIPLGTISVRNLWTLVMNGTTVTSA